jgi:hypothetical protein
MPAGLRNFASINIGSAASSSIGAPDQTTADKIIPAPFGNSFQEDMHLPGTESICNGFGTDAPAGYDAG